MSREVHVQFWERVGVKFPCATHLPLYRQSVMLERELGLEISRATLDGWVMRVGELLRPIKSCWPEAISKPMKPRSESNAKGCEAKITKPTPGNTVGQVEG